MADGTEATAVVSDDPPKPEEQGDSDGGLDGDPEGGLTDAQTELLEKCLHSLKHAKNDSHTLAALLLITRVCPANQLDKSTLKRIFEAVGLNLPARLLVTAVKGADTSSLPPHELLSLGMALLAALSTDPDMASHPQLLATIPILLGILVDSPVRQHQQVQAGNVEADHEKQSAGSVGAENNHVDAEGRTDSRNEGDDHSEARQESTRQSSKLDEALFADCYQVLTAVCMLPKGPDQLLSRGAIPALCQAVEQNQYFSRDKGLALLCCLLSSTIKDKIWSKHSAQLLSLLVDLSKDFCQARDEDRLDKCAELVHFLPPLEVNAESEELKGAVVCVWAALRPMLQSKLTPRQIGPVLVLSACLLDLFGWEPVGPPKFCCLLVNRACVEVRMGLEEPPGHNPSPEMQHTLTGCYRIMEAAIEQACCQAVPLTDAQPQGCITTLTLQQSRQVLGVLEEAFSAQIYHLQQVEPSGYADPFIFATFRCLCSWLAEETSCLKEEVIRLLPFLIGYSRSHLQGERSEQGVSDWMSSMSVSGERGAWTRKDALRYLLPALCHLSAEEGPRKVLLTLDTQALLVDFLSKCWTLLRGRSKTSLTRDPSMETACSVLLNLAVTEPERVREDPSFKALEDLLSEALPVLVHKPCLQVIGANFCTLGLMIGRLRPAPASGSGEPSQRRFFSTALRFLRSALDAGSSPGPLQVSSSWEESWDETAELWRLGVQALGGCVRAQPWITVLVREEGWLKHVAAMLAQCCAIPDQHTQAALEEALSAMAEQCPTCKMELAHMMTSSKGALRSMKKLKKLVEAK